MFMCVVLVAGCSPSPSWMKSFQASSSITIYEGLPHQLREAELLDQEMQRSDIVRIGDFVFYTPGVTPDTPEEEQFKILISQSGFYSARTLVPPDCGPFHPDFAVEWMSEGLTHHILICFTCNEVQVISENAREEYYVSHIHDLEMILSKFSHKRP